MRSLARARYLLASEHGRRDGWYVELDGAPVGELDDARSEDMFWDPYAVTASPGGAVIHDDSLWNAGRFTFRSRSAGEVVETALCGGRPPFVRDGRVLLRGLYLAPRGPAQRALLRLLSPLGPRSRGRERRLTGPGE
jgi:hypothetical protein